IVQNNGFPTLCLPNRPVAVVSVWKPDNRTQLINNIGGKRMIDDLHYPVTIQDRGKSPIGTCGLETICEVSILRLYTTEGRKEKLGEKITTIQGLVCPFGKTETASVLFECIEYIRFLHEQIQILSSPYLGTASSSMRIQQKSVHGERNCAFLEHPVQDSQDKAKDLRSRGLCLVSVSHSVVQMGQNNIGDFVSALKWEVEQRSLKMGQIQFPLRALEEWALPDDSLIILNNVVLNTASLLTVKSFDFHRI
ncbi:hypothetical protein D5086_027285, partial [Populus alba]